MSRGIHVDQTTRGQIWSRKLGVEQDDGEFDLAFWQAQNAEARFSAAWEMVETAWKMKGRPADELRLQRTACRPVPFPG
jgi:hypothetical protein